MCYESASIPDNIHVYFRPFYNHLSYLRRLNTPGKRKWEKDFTKKITSERPLVLFYGYPTQTSWIPLLKPELILFDVLDDYGDFPDVKKKPERMKEIQEEFDVLLRNADVITVSSERLKRIVDDNLKKRTEIETVLLPNGCEPEHFGRVNALNYENRVVYFGALANWLDEKLLYDVAQLLPAVQFDLYGPISSFNLKNLPTNVKWHGFVAYRDLPSFLQAAGVAIIPFRSDSTLIQATNPIKFFEYMSAGLPVVSTVIPELIQYCNPEHLILTNDTVEFAKALKKFLEEEKNTPLRAKRIQHRREFARQHSWNSRANKLNQELHNALLRKHHPLSE